MDGDPNAQLIRRSMDRRAADILREQILSGQLPPGTRLVEAQLAEQVHVSRGTVRSALSELAHQGLVQQIAYTRWQVPDLTAQDAWEIYTLRGVLEGFGARLAAESQNKDKSKLLKKACRALAVGVKSGHLAKAAEADFGLHRTIIALSDHQRLMKQYELIQQQVRRYMSFSNDILIIPEEIVIEHETLVDLILEGEAEKAEHVAKTHNVEECQVLHDYLVKMAEQGAEGMASRAPRKR
jgi:DNA-binding GntR family transcriptional regulator